MNKNLNKKNCEFCSKIITLQNYQSHKETCYLNPENIKNCKVCGKPTKFKTSTCSKKCRYIYFGFPNKDGKNGIDSEPSYRKICFATHPYYCIICHENLIVAVHHYDENKNNNESCNLIPLCLTHHCYMHCKYKEVIIEKVDMFIMKCYRDMWE
jgi:hypothetical protein